MPKLNTYVAAALAASTLIAPVNAGEPNSHYVSGGHYAAPYSGAPATSGAALGYASSQSYATSNAYVSGNTAYANASASASGGGYAAANSSATAQGGYHGGGANYTMNTNGPVNLTADEIVCVMGTQEVPCDTVPGLTEALHAQGLHSIANALPPIRPGLNGYGTPAYAGYGAGQYAGGQYVAASSNSYASGNGTAYTGSSASAGSAYGASATSYSTAGVTSYGSTRQYVSTGATSYGQGYYGGQAPGYASEVWVTPCGQVVTKTVRHAVSPCAAYVPAPVIYERAPVSVRLSDGTVFALNGGVGAGIYGEFYGGGGSIIQGGSSYSGVLNASASQFTFKHKKTTPTPHTRYPKPNPRYPKPHTRYPNHGGKSGGGCNGGC